MRLGIDIFNALGGRGDPLQRGRQPERTAREQSPAAVGFIFARAADRHLHQHGPERSQDHNENAADRAQRIVAPFAAAEEEREIRQHRNGAGNRRGDGHDQRVMVLDVGKLMRQHAGKLLLAQTLKDARHHAHRGMLGTAPGGKRVGLWVLRDIDFGHG